MGDKSQAVVCLPEHSVKISLPPLQHFPLLSRRLCHLHLKLFVFVLNLAHQVVLDLAQLTQQCIFLHVDLGQLGGQHSPGLLQTVLLQLYVTHVFHEGQLDLRSHLM